MKKILSAFLGATLCLFSMPFSLQGYADDYKAFNGSGTEGDPYQISSSYELRLLSELVNDPDTTAEYTSCYYIQTADIDLKNVNFVPIGLWNPVNTPFHGNYNGNYHEISNLNINRNTNYTGLFGIIQNGKISNLSVNGNVSGSIENEDWVLCGGIVGEISNNACVVNCSFTGNVSGNKHGVGGIAGQLVRGGEITSCYFNGNVESDTLCCGGIVGYVSDHAVTCVNKVRNCYAVGKINKTKDLAGGIVGNSYHYQDEADYIFENNYYLNSMTSTGIMQTGKNDGNGCNALSENLLKNSAEMLGSPFVFNADEAVNDGYPVFEWQITPYQFKGSGTESDPYQISSKEELKMMRDLVNNRYFSSYQYAHYIQTADIDLENEQWVPIGKRMKDGVDGALPYFSGYYNGNYHKIKNLYVNETEKFAGLFGALHDGGIIENLEVSGKVTGTISVGGVCGEICSGNGVVQNCCFIGGIEGSYSSGGVVGYLWQAGMIKNCYHNGIVNNVDCGGGIVGHITVGSYSGEAIVENCYHTGNMTGDSHLGSVVGYMNNEQILDGKICVKNCYALNSDCATTSNGTADICNILSLTPNLLKMVAEDLGTAFVKNPDNSLNNGYPVFTWQVSGTGDVNGDGVFGVADVILFQKWLLKVPDVKLSNWKAADFYADGVLNVFDLCLMKRMLINQS